MRTAGVWIGHQWEFREGTFIVRGGQEGEIKTRQEEGGGGEGQGEGRVSRAGGALLGGDLHFCTDQTRCNSISLTHHLYGITKANRGLLFPQTRSCLSLTRKNAQRGDVVEGTPVGGGWHKGTLSLAPLKPRAPSRQGSWLHLRAKCNQGKKKLTGRVRGIVLVAEGAKKIGREARREHQHECTGRIDTIVSACLSIFVARGTLLSRALS